MSYNLPPHTERRIEDLLLDMIERYESGDTNVNEYTIDRYLHGCGCLYCGKSTIPDRSPEKDICTPADCARGLAEWFRRMEDE